MLIESDHLEWEDRRKDYGEIRYCALGQIEGRVFFASFTRRGENVGIISFRKANARETRHYREHLPRENQVGSNRLEKG